MNTVFLAMIFGGMLVSPADQFDDALAELSRGMANAGQFL